MRHQRLQKLSQAKLYLCTDARRERGDFSQFIHQVLANGVDIIQLRDKGSPGEKLFGPLEPRQELDLLSELTQTAAHYGALVAVNDRADIAYAAHVDILHLGQHDLPIHIARDIVGPDILIGHSTHSYDQMRQALTKDIDYFCVGPCWPTPTKPGRASTGLDLLTQAHRCASCHPWFAIGGINSERLPQVRAAGGDRIVVVRAITHADNPGQAARYLRDQLN